MSDRSEVVVSNFSENCSALPNDKIEPRAEEQTQKSDLQKKKFLLLTTSLLVDRVFQYTNLIPRLKEFGEVNIWASSANVEEYNFLWSRAGLSVVPFPEILPFREYFNYLRRFNEHVWDYRYAPPSRMSMERHVRSKTRNRIVQTLRIPAFLMSKIGAHDWLENQVESLLVNYPRSQSAIQMLEADKPSVIMTTGLYQFDQPAISAAAKKLNIPVLAYIPSWDNVSTKSRFVFKYDGFVVWSEKIKNELHYYYPFTRNKPVYVCGAPQFDIFFQEKYYRTRAEFCRQHKLDPDLPIILYALGSPNFLKEHHGALRVAEKVKRGEFGKVQMLVRPHPIHDNSELKSMFDKFQPGVRLQNSKNAGLQVKERSQDEMQIVEWINTFRHSDVVINLSSTVTVDAAIFDKPVVNLDFDPQPDKSHQQLIKEINHLWEHFKPIAESGGVWLVNDYDELAEAVKTYLANPALHREKRRWVAEHVCGFLDGKCGERMADAIADFAQRHF